MVKKICLIFFIVFSTFSFASSEYDKDIVVKNLTRTDKIRLVFAEMMRNYEEEDIEGFFSFVSEDRFEQDYMTFFDAIDEDIRIYDILSVETYENKISEDGIKRILNIQWTKRYESARPVRLNRRDLDASNRYEIIQNGTTDFTFDEINGHYKLIKIAGNNFWGGSLSEWREEVGDIAGQSSKDVAGDNVNGVYTSEQQKIIVESEDEPEIPLPNLTFGCDKYLHIINDGLVDINEPISYIWCESSNCITRTYSDGIQSNGITPYLLKDNGDYIQCPTDSSSCFYVDSDKSIEESNEDDNYDKYSNGNCPW